MLKNNNSLYDITVERFKISYTLPEKTGYLVH